MCQQMCVIGINLTFIKWRFDLVHQGTKMGGSFFCEFNTHFYAMFVNNLISDVVASSLFSFMFSCVPSLTFDVLTHRFRISKWPSKKLFSSVDRKWKTYGLRMGSRLKYIRKNISGRIISEKISPVRNFSNEKYPRQNISS